jgi:hypothetical protein
VSKYPVSAFDKVRDNRLQTIRHFDVDLSSARSAAVNTAKDYAVSGDSFYVDADPLGGFCTIYLTPRDNSQAEVPLFVSPGFILNVPFTSIRVENTAQVGKKIRIVYGINVDFQPGSVSQVSISGGVTNRPEASTGQFIASGTLNANTVNTIFTPGQNPNGTIVQLAEAQDTHSIDTLVDFGFFYFTSAPASPNAAGIFPVCLSQRITNGGASASSSCILRSDAYIPAGNGFYCIGSQATAGTSRRQARWKTL